MGKGTDDGLQGLESGADFSKKGRLMGNQVKRRVATPKSAQFGVEHDGLIQRLVTDGISTLNGATSDGGGFEKDDGVITGEFLFKGGLDAREVAFFRIRPVGGSIDCATVTKQNPSGIERVIFALQVSLDVENGGLSVTLSRRLGSAGKATLE